MRGLVWFGCWWLVGCSTPTDGSTDATDDTGEVTLDTSPPPLPATAWSQAVLVTLDGAPAVGATVLQGGTTRHVAADAEGRATLVVDPTVPGGPIVVASAPGARIQGVDLRGDLGEVTVALTSFATDDNVAYVFQDPGTPERNATTQYCSHCHDRQVNDWVTTPHATAASNPVTLDVYRGTATLDEAACGVRGGVWTTTRKGGGGTEAACRLGGGVLPDLDPACDDGALCDDPTVTGACADCHAPGIDGALGGRDLLDATGIAFDHGVHCDVCHKVADVDLDAPAGVAGRLQIVRPLEPPTSAVFDWEPLTFGPRPDVLNPRMGSVWSPLHSTSTFCAGCHELDQAVLLPGAVIDATRWPDGVLPIHSTFSEWAQGPLADVAPCQSCHMPPAPEAGNSADLDRTPAVRPGRTGGWWRPPGTVRRHTWSGPRDPQVPMVDRALSGSVAVAVDEGDLVVDVDLRQTGPGHAVPTGEPLRSVVLTVDARCDGTSLAAVDGPAVPSFGGALAVQDAGGDWGVWPQASVGDVVRVVEDVGWVDYAGVGPFGDGTFDAEAKGLRDLRVRGAATVTAVGAQGVVTLDGPLPSGDLAFLGRPRGATEGPIQPLAGAPGMAFARVLVDDAGTEMVPHHRAVDVAIDNRLMPEASWSGTYRFDGSCEVPDVVATVRWRGLPWALAAERGWDAPERAMLQVRP